MITINLEKELLKQNKKIVTDAQLLHINEYEKVADNFNDNTLERIGIMTAKIGKEVKNSIDASKLETEMFNQDRVFHISQIEEICNKYYLKFLPTCLYKGSIDKDLPFKINNFETAYKVKCFSREREYNWEENKGNTFIIAPSESFKLQARPLDPLLFYKINDEYYYLIHKWGNDLNIFRRLKAIFSSQLLSFTVFHGVLLSIIYCFINYEYPAVYVPLIIIGVVLIGGGFMAKSESGSKGAHLAFYQKNNYNSPFED